MTKRQTSLPLESPWCHPEPVYPSLTENLTRLIIQRRNLSSNINANDISDSFSVSEKNKIVTFQWGRQAIKTETKK